MIALSYDEGSVGDNLPLGRRKICNLIVSNGLETIPAGFGGSGSTLSIQRTGLDVLKVPAKVHSDNISRLSTSAFPHEIRVIGILVAFLQSG